LIAGDLGFFADAADQYAELSGADADASDAKSARDQIDPVEVQKPRAVGAVAVHAE